MLQLLDHQRRLVELAREHPRFGVFWEPGCGKTIGLLAVVAAAKAAGYAGRTLVVAPKSILWTAWARDAGNFPGLRLVVCYHESRGRRMQLIGSAAAGGADVLVTNFEQFRLHADDFLQAGVTRLVIDESSKVKSNRAIGGESKITRAAIEFADRCDSVYLLSGTPAPNTELEYFSQVRCIDRRTFGVHAYAFANTYFFPTKRRMRVNGEARDVIVGWKLRGDRATDFTEKLRSVSWSLRAAECVDLPEESDDVREVELSAAERKAYAACLADLRLELADGRAVDVAANAKLMKLRQITGGAFLVEGQAHPAGRSKLDALAELIEEIGDAPLVVWAEFTHEIDAIANLIGGRLERAVAVIDGRTPADRRASDIKGFQEGWYRYIVAHPAAAGHGVTLTAARHDCFFSLGWVPENHEQARKRIHRVGQRWPVVHHYLVCPGTVDARIRDVLTRKATAAEAVKALLGRPVGGERTRQPLEAA